MSLSSYKRCTGIYKLGNNTYPRRIRRRSNLGRIFRGEKSASYGLGNTVNKYMKKCIKLVISKNLHMCISCSVTHLYRTCVMCSVKKHVLNGACCVCNCCTLLSVIWSNLCAECIYILFHIKLLTCVQFGRFSAMISMAAASKTGTNISCCQFKKTWT